MVAGVHFLPGRTSWQDVGWKALAVNLSDIAAMGGEPHLALMTLALPPDFCVEDAQALYRGLHEAADGLRRDPGRRRHRALARVLHHSGALRLGAGIAPGRHLGHDARRCP